ncbi:MAG: SHD1 domain-containing protein [Thermoguttaceae bacterium]
MKKIACLAVFFGLCVLVVSISAGEIRTWTAGGGKFSTEAEFIETSPDGTMVSLRKKDGKEIQVAIEKLSEADQEYITKQSEISPVKPVEQNPIDDSVFKVTAENFVRYEDDGPVVIRSKSGDERKEHVQGLTQDDLNCILEQEIKSLASDKFFSPEQIKSQIDAYCAANPIKKTEYVKDEEAQRRKNAAEAEHKKKKAEYEKRRDTLDKQLLAAKSDQQRDKIIKAMLGDTYPSMEYISVSDKAVEITIGLSQYEKNSLCLMLLKLQELKGDKYTQGNFDGIMREIFREKEYSSRSNDTFDAYRINQILYKWAESDDISNRYSRAITAESMVDTAKSMQRAGAIGASTVAISIEGANQYMDEYQSFAPKLETIYPYSNKYSAFRHAEEETKRVGIIDEANRKKELEERSKELFK